MWNIQSGMLINLNISIHNNIYADIWRNTVHAQFSNATSKIYANTILLDIKLYGLLTGLLLLPPDVSYDFKNV